MSNIRPPRAATWLLERFSTGLRRSEMVGDLIEQYSNGRSAWWYWRQALGSLMLFGWADLRDHPLLAARAAAVAWATFAALSTVSVLLFGNRPFSPVAFLAVHATWYLVSAFTTVRLHRRSYAGTACLLVALVVLWNAPDLWRMSLNAMVDPRYRPYLYERVIQTIFVCMATFLGALLCPPLEEEPTQESQRA